MQTEAFGNLPTGEQVDAITLRNVFGGSVRVLTLGGIVTSLNVPDRNRPFADVVLGFDRLESYMAPHPYFGAIVGRVAGRIPRGQLVLDGTTYQLAKNNAPNHLHGGCRGLDKRIWRATEVKQSEGSDSVRLTYHSPDGEEGYPGAVDLCVTYTLTADHTFMIESEAIADRITPVNLTHHSYFNLAGEGTGNIFDHQLTVFSGRVFAVDESMAPTGPLGSVTGSAADFTAPRRLGDSIPGLFKNHGDLYFLKRPGATKPVAAAHLSHPSSGRFLTVSTPESCLQIYTGAALDGSLIGNPGGAISDMPASALNVKDFPQLQIFPDTETSSSPRTAHCARPRIMPLQRIDTTCPEIQPDLIP
ncbi:MAG: aldose epimerase family protein [Verrucomicrobiota bacterium]